MLALTILTYVLVSSGCSGSQALFSNISQELLLFLGIFSLKFINTSSGIHDLIGTSVERVAIRADLNPDSLHSALHKELSAANTSCNNGFRIWMNICFHELEF